MAEELRLKAQPGPQLKFLATKADIAIYGGAAGGGKTHALLLAAMRRPIDVPNFYAAVFRRNAVQVRNPGGLWDQSMRIYGACGARPFVAPMEWQFPSGGRVKFSHLENESSVLDWQGSEVPFLGFDELTHFMASQFWYMLSRNRSMSGVRPYVRATCNPDADSWVADLIAWWIDQTTGLPIQERAGVLRWFVRVNDTLHWGDTAAELEALHPGSIAKSLTFIPAKLSDNAALMAADPGYRANLMALPTVERERLLGGNWKIRPSAGLYFQRAWCEVVDALPAGLRFMRGWDLAATEKTETNDPDWTAGTKIGRSQAGVFYVAHHTRLRGSPMKVQTLVLNTASQDGRECSISIPLDPGQSGVAQKDDYARLLAAYRVTFTAESRGGLATANTPHTISAKVSRFGPFSAQAQAGNVKVLRGAWNETWFASLEGFPDASHDDDADSTSRAYGELVGGPTTTVKQLRL